MKFTMMIAASAVAVTALGATADTSRDSGGIATGKSMNAVTPLGENHMLVKSHSTYEKMAMNDAAHPYNGMSGECFGSFEMKIPSAAGSGNCVFSDADGDVSASRFEVTGMTSEGAITGTWAIIGGTGKFAGASGGGNFHNVSDNAAGTFENTISGAMILP